MNRKRTDNDCSRREFLGRCGSALAGVTIAGFVAPLFAGCEASTTRPPDTSGTGDGNKLTFDVSGLDADGKAFVTTQKGPDGRPVLIVRRSAGEFIALSMTCTHESCPVSPPVNNVINCGCHGSQFALDGSVLRGPATQPLKEYASTYDASTGRLTVTLA